MPTFSSEAELRKYILKKSYRAVEAAQEEVYQIIESFLIQYYNDFTPEFYERTYQLLCSLVKSNIRYSGGGIEADIYFDASMLDYKTGSWTGEQVLGAALHGSHGGYTRTAPIYGQSMNVLNAQAINILKENLIKAGIPVM